MMLVTAAIEPSLALNALTVAPALGILTWTYRQRLRSRHREVKALESSALALIQEVLTSVSGCAGAFVFSWTDKWHRRGHEIEDWDFGLTTRDCGPKLALGAVSQAFDRKPVQNQTRRPRVSVVVCSCNGARTLRNTLETTDHVRVGGPVIAPAGDGAIADCVGNAPGGPIHVLLSDREAEHIPGCNMAFRQGCLEAVGGFDPQFRAAGDDVDLCWRLQQRDWTHGFHPAAVVWHHRHNSLRAYWRQQRGYGRAEALPERYNSAGHLTWRGRRRWWSSRVRPT